MKVALILPTNIWFCPYVNIYTALLEKSDCEYEIISWNRDGTEPNSTSSFNSVTDKKSSLRKTLSYINYIQFIKNLVKSNGYDKLIIFGPQLGIFLSTFLEKNFKNRFIFDYRDLSIDQFLPFKKNLRKTLDSSFLNVISSPGFKKYLPESNFVISHNLDFETAKKQQSLFTSSSNFINNEINILTIGSIRDYESNLEIINALANKPYLKLSFVGKGIASDKLEKYVKDKNFLNVTFVGFYKKEEEANFISKATFLNVYYPKVKSHSSALSNRFYNSLIFKKPMIVTSESIQGEFVENHQLGLSINNSEKLYEKIISFKDQFDSNRFDLSSAKIFDSIELDYRKFENEISRFLNT